MLASPEFTKNGTESCYNKSVETIINIATEKGKQLVSDNKFTTCLNLIREELHKFSGVELQTKRSTCVSPVLIKAEQLTRGKDKELCHDMNAFMSEIINNYDIIESGECKPLPDNFNDMLKSILGFGFDPKMLTTKPDVEEPSEYFSRRWSWYNQSVNFEHVCFVVACILMRKVEFKPQYAEKVVYPFLFFITKYGAHKDILMFFMYHLMKFIRIYHTRGIGEGVRFWNPVVYMTNLNFGCYVDPNVEIYGNVRLSRNEKDILSMFSNAPRSTAMTNEHAIWLNWNNVTPIISKFSYTSEGIWREVFGQEDKSKVYTNVIEFFKFLTIKDIIPRSNLAKNGFINLYHRCVVEEGKEASDEEMIEMVIDLLTKVGAVEHTPGRRLGATKIGITYFKGTKIASKVLNITLDDLSNRLNSSPKKVENVSLVPYIVKCSINGHGHICRKEYSSDHVAYERLLKEIEDTKESIDSL